MSSRQGPGGTGDPSVDAAHSDAPDARLLRTFLDLVRIDSPSGKESEIAGYCARALANAGFTVSSDDSHEGTGSDTGNLIAMKDGVAPGRPMVLSAHMDCVRPCEGIEPVIVGGQVSSAGDTVLGADDKAGVAAILEAARRVTEDDRAHAAIQVVLTTAEELGLKGAKALDPSVLRGDLCLVLDAEGTVGGIVTASPTHYTFAATFRGKASHAGVSPEEGVSAIRMAARAVESMPLGRLDEETTANIGTVSGGTATNVVAAEVSMTGECRSRVDERVEQVRREMEGAMRSAAGELGGTVDVEWTKEYSGVRLDEEDPVLGLVKTACLETGLEPRTFATGGGSDGNIFAAAGIPTLVLSCGMRGVHSTEETIEVAQLEALTRLVEAILARAVT